MVVRYLGLALSLFAVAAEADASGGLHGLLGEVRSLLADNSKERAENVREHLRRLRQSPVDWDPDSRALMEQSVQALVAAIHGEVRLSMTNTQNDIDKLEGNLTSQVLIVNNSKVTATDEDKLLWGCHLNERNALDQYEQAIDALHTAQANYDAVCSGDGATSTFTRSHSPFRCQQELDNKGHCQDEWTQYRDALRGKVDVMRNDLASHAGAFHAFRQTCNSLKAKIDNSRGDADAYWNAYVDNHTDCKSQQQVQETAICNFKRDWDLTCLEKSSYEDLIGGIQSPTGPVAWMEREWGIARIVECLIDGLLDDTGVDADAFDVRFAKCKDKNDFENTLSINDEAMLKALIPVNCSATGFMFWTATMAVPGATHNTTHNSTTEQYEVQSNVMVPLSQLAWC